MQGPQQNHPGQQNARVIEDVNPRVYKFLNQESTLGIPWCCCLLTPFRPMCLLGQEHEDERRPGGEVLTAEVLGQVPMSPGKS